MTVTANVFYTEYELENVRKWMVIEGDEAFEDIAAGWPKYKDVFQVHVKEKNVAVQAGGYCGVFPRMLSNMFQRVYTFEPDPINFFCLANNTPSSNVYRYQAALGKEHGLISMDYMCLTNAGMKKVGTAPGVIPTMRVDDLKLERCDLLMLDIEGYEFNAILGAEETIDKYRPVISVEDTNPLIENVLSAYRYQKIAEVYRDTIYAA